MLVPAMPGLAPRFTLVAIALTALPAGGAPSAPQAAPAAPVQAEAQQPLAASLASIADDQQQASSPSTAPAPAPDGETCWTTGPDYGTGVAMKDTGNALGSNAFIGYAGYGVGLDDAETWVDALYDAWLRERGVRYVWAVRGPDDSHYEHKEIGNTKIGARLRAVAPAASFVLVAAHSSGSCVAHELFKQLAEGRDPEGVTAGKIVYFNLDGIEKGLTPDSAARLRRAYFVAAVDRATDTVSPNANDMRRTAELYAHWAPASYMEHDARAAGCAEGGRWCLHVTLVTNGPHDSRAARAHLDYTDFAAAGVATSFRGGPARTGRGPRSGDRRSLPPGSSTSWPPRRSRSSSPARSGRAPTCAPGPRA
jgi:hypothetical protein